MSETQVYEAYGPITAVSQLQVQTAGGSVMSLQAALAAGGNGGMVAPATLTVTQQPPALAIYQRAATSEHPATTGGAFGLGSGLVPIGITLSAASVVLWQVRDATSNAVVDSGAKVAPAGASIFYAPVSARAGWGYLDVAPPGGSFFAGTNKIGVGEVIAIGGQSLAEYKLHQFTDTTNTSASLGITPSQFSSTFVSWGGGGVTGPAASWVQAADGTAASAINSTWATEFPRLLVGTLGVSVGIIGYPVGSTALSTWQPGQANNTALKTVLMNAGGKFGTFIWTQGHSDSAGLPVLAGPTGIQALVSNIFTDLIATFGQFKLILQSIPDVDSTAWGSSSNVNLVRTGYLQYAAANPSFVIHNTSLDIETNPDGTHEDNIGARTFARHDWRAVKQAMGLDPIGDQGPAFLNGARPPGSAIITLPMNLVGGTALVGVGTLASQFQVFAHGNLSTPLTIASAAISGLNVVVTLSSAPANSVALDVWYRYGTDSGTNNVTSSAGIYDNNTADGLSQGRQAQLMVTPIVIAAPDGSTPAATNTSPLTFTNATFAASTASAFGNAMTAGYAATGSGFVPPAPPFYIECWVTATANTGATALAVAQSGAWYFGMGGTGLAFAQLAANAITSTVSLTDGARHHLRLFFGPTTTFFFVDGVNVGNTATPKMIGSIYPLGIRAFYTGGFPWTTSGSVDEVAIIAGTPPLTGFTPPTAPYTGAEPGFIVGWHLDSNAPASFP